MNAFRPGEVDCRKNFPRLIVADLVVRFWKSDAEVLRKIECRGDFRIVPFRAAGRAAGVVNDSVVGRSVSHLRPILNT